MRYLYRGFSLTNNKWVYGSLLEWQDGTCEICVDNDDGKLDKYTVAKDSVGLFTGLLDKNGNKIFGGDIIDFLDWKDAPLLPVVWYDKECRFGIDVSEHNNLKHSFEEKHVWLLQKLEGTEMEIIGNVYENKDLL